MFSAHDFAARLSTQQDRWSLLKDFIAEWHGPLEPGDGYSAGELDAAEQRLGLKMPEALREWYALAGRRKDIVAVQNFLRQPDRLFTQEQDGVEVLYFYTENQACVNWGILVSNSEDGYQWIWIGARSQSALKDAAQRFSIAWECLDLD